MEFVSTTDQDQLRDTVREWLARTGSEARLREVMASETGRDENAWQELASGIGAHGLLVEETYGGSGAGFAEMTVVLEEMGRAVYCGPFLSTGVLGASALGRSEDPALAGTYLPRLVAGDLVVGVAPPRPSGGPPVTARRSGSAVRLTGSLATVLDGYHAEVLVLPARTASGAAPFLVEASAAGLSRAPLATMDQTRRLARVDLDGVAARPLAREPVAAAALLDRLAGLAWVGLACEQVGGAQRCVELSAEHARNRVQFGVPIGTFQAIKHTCADMLAAVELARSAAGRAAWCADHDPGDLPIMARLAKSLCSETYRQAAANTVQIHGGLGFTWDHPAHLYFKRAKSSELLFGQPAEHRDALGRLLGLCEPDDDPSHPEGVRAWPC
jgi:alkylation response protein AidB-like acyl-CoA dehydrogenase